MKLTLNKRYKGDIYHEKSVDFCCTNESHGDKSMQTNWNYYVHLFQEYGYVYMDVKGAQGLNVLKLQIRNCPFCGAAIDIEFLGEGET